MTSTSQRDDRRAEDDGRRTSSQRSQSTQTPQVPEELFEHYIAADQNQVAEELASEIVKNIRKTAPPRALQQAAFVKDKIAEQLEKLIPTPARSSAPRRSARTSSR